MTFRFMWCLLICSRKQDFLLKGKVLTCRAGHHGKISMEHSSKITTMTDFVNNRQDLCTAFFGYISLQI